MPNKTCPHCQRLYLRPLSPKAVYCDGKCQKEAERGMRPNCKRCSASFTLRGSKRNGDLRRYCSPRCIYQDKRPFSYRKTDQRLNNWSKAVRNRDAVCQFFIRGRTNVGIPHGGGLVAHHVKQKSTFPESKYDVTNGLGVCADHHTWIHDHETYAARLGLLITRKTAYTPCSGP